MNSERTIYTLDDPTTEKYNYSWNVSSHLRTIEKSESVKNVWKEKSTRKESYRTSSAIYSTKKSIWVTFVVVISSYLKQLT